MKAQDIRNGDLVLITDGSYAVRVDSFERCTSIGLCRDVFEVIDTVGSSNIKCFNGSLIHDIYIKNTVSGEVYLHSAQLVKKKVERECVCCCKCCNK